MKKIKESEWCWWNIDTTKAVKCYNDNLEWTGWLYWREELVHLTIN